MSVKSQKLLYRQTRLIKTDIDRDKQKERAKKEKDREKERAKGKRDKNRPADRVT